MNRLIEALEKKNKIREEIEDKYHINFKNVLKDPHSRRKPIACGLTIHTGVGCPYKCRYCYIYSMGFPEKITRYPLSPPEIIYSILLNPWFVPGRYGTFLALGSVTEPFHPVTRKYTLELLSLINKYLGNPTQLSSKDKIDKEYSKDVSKSHKELSILYTVTTLNYSKDIEPYAPNPIHRFESMKYLVGEGLHVTLFIRPIIPGVTDRENLNILSKAMEHGVDKVVYGTLRINKDIYNALMDLRIDNLTRELEKRVDNNDLGVKQQYIHGPDLKERLVSQAIKLGYKVFPSACSANIDSVSGWCNMCKFGPCGYKNSRIIASVEEVEEYIEYMGLKGKIKVLDMDEMHITVKVVGRGKDVNYVLEHIKAVTKLRMSVRRVKC